LKFDKSSSDLLPKTKKTLAGAVTLLEDPLFKDAGILVPPFIKFKKWTQKITISIAVTFEASKAGEKSKTASITRTLEWALRPLFQKDDKDPPKPTPPRPFPPPDPDFDWRRIPIPQAIAALLCYLNYYDLPQIIQQLPESLMTGLLEDISTSMGEIQQVIYNVLRGLNQSQKTVAQLSSETKTASTEIESAEAEVETAEAEVETVEAEVTTAEEALAGAGRLEDACRWASWQAQAS
jgi:hypothetical protein